MSPARRDLDEIRAAIERMMERPGLAVADRFLVALAALGALGFPADMRWMIGAARRGGLSLAEIREILVQLIPYCGWPIGLNALMVAREELAAEGESLDHGLPADAGEAPTREALRALGLETARRVNPLFDRVGEAVRRIDPALVDHLAEAAYGYVYNRPGLTLRQRELAAVAVLAVQSQAPQLKYHIRGALNAGATSDEVREALIQIHLYAGWPLAVAALEAWQEMTSRP